MTSITILSGPIGAGKSTVARELIPLMPAPLSYIDGDTYWSFIAKSSNEDRKEDFRLIMRAMMASARSFARSGYHVLLDFTMPFQFVSRSLQKLEGIDLNYVVLRPDMEVCAGRAASREEGRISDYEQYRSFYAIFAASDDYSIRDNEADAAAMAARIWEGLSAGAFRVNGKS